MRARGAAAQREYAMSDENDVQRTLGRIEGKMDQVLESGKALKAYTEKEVSELKEDLKTEKAERKAFEEKASTRIQELEKALWKWTGGGVGVTALLTYGPRLLAAVSGTAGHP